MARTSKRTFSGNPKRSSHRQIQKDKEDFDRIGAGRIQRSPPLPSEAELMGDPKKSSQRKGAL